MRGTGTQIVRQPAEVSINHKPTHLVLSRVCWIEEHEQRRLQDRDPLRPSFFVGVVLSVLWGGGLLLFAEVQSVPT